MSRLTAPSSTTQSYASVNRAFSKQSLHFDEEDFNNPILQSMRSQVRRHVNKFLKPADFMLELNAGTGLDAVFFALQGNEVLATDLSDGMIDQLNSKIKTAQVNNLSARQLSYDELYQLKGRQFDYVFSNFGGLNCIQDLSNVTVHLPDLLKPGAKVTWVIMPPFCPWDWLAVFRGHFNHAFRRLKKGGVKAHLEGEYFSTYYHSVSTIRKVFGKSFQLVCCEGLGVFVPPPDKKYLPARYPQLYKLLQTLDRVVRHHYPFNRWADHVIVTFQFKG